MSTTSIYTAEKETNLEPVKSPTGKSIDLIDLVKLILSFMIVAIHTTIFPAALYPWLRLAVPLFFVISSYLFFNKVNQCETAKEKNAALKSFIFRNLRLYAFWFIAQFPYYFVARGWFDYGIINGIINLLVNMIFGSTFVASWFMSALIIGTVAIFFASKKLSGKALLGIGIVFYLIVSLRSSYVVFFKDVTAIINAIIAYESYLPSPYNSFPVGIFWIACGKIFADGGFNFKKESTYCNLAVSLVLLLGECFIVKQFTGDMNKDCYLMLAPCVISIFCIIRSYQDVEIKNAQAMRKLSVIIYASHGAIIGIISTLWKMVISPTVPAIVVFLLVSVAATCMGIVFIWLEKYKLFKWLKYSH